MTLISQSVGAVATRRSSSEQGWQPVSQSCIIVQSRRWGSASQPAGRSVAEARSRARWIWSMHLSFRFFSVCGVRTDLLESSVTSICAHAVAVPEKTRITPRQLVYLFMVFIYYIYLFSSAIARRQNIPVGRLCDCKHVIDTFLGNCSKNKIKRHILPGVFLLPVRLIFYSSLKWNNW